MSALSTEMRAFLAAVARTGRTGALSSLPTEMRARLSGAGRVEAGDLLAGVPVGLTEVHPTWIPAEAPEVEAALAGRGSVSAPWLTWLRRRLYGHLVPMPPGLPRDLVKDVETIGRGRLALATKAAPRGADRLLASRLGSGHAAAFLAEVAVSAPPEQVSVAVRELARLDPDGPTLFCAGARHLGPAVAAMGGDWPRRLAQRLPRPLGQILLAEVGADRKLQPGAAEKLAAIMWWR